MNKQKFISVGKILNFHGVQCEAKFGYSKNKEDFLKQLDEVYILHDNEYKPFKIKQLRFTPKVAIIKFENINSLNEILAYKGALVFIKDEEAQIIGRR